MIWRAPKRGEAQSWAESRMLLRVVPDDDGYGDTSGGFIQLFTDGTALRFCISYEGDWSEDTPGAGLQVFWEIGEPKAPGVGK